MMIRAFYLVLLLLIFTKADPDNERMSDINSDQISNSSLVDKVYNSRQENGGSLANFTKILDFVQSEESGFEENVYLEYAGDAFGSDYYLHFEDSEEIDAIGSDYFEESGEFYYDLEETSTNEDNNDENITTDEDDESENTPTNEDNDDESITLMIMMIVKTPQLMRTMMMKMTQLMMMMVVKSVQLMRTMMMKISLLMMMMILKSPHLMRTMMMKISLLMMMIVKSPQLMRTMIMKMSLLMMMRMRVVRTVLRVSLVIMMMMRMRRRRKRKMIGEIKCMLMLLIQQLD